MMALLATMGVRKKKGLTTRDYHYDSMWETEITKHLNNKIIDSIPYDIIMYNYACMSVRNNPYSYMYASLPSVLSIGPVW